MKLNTIIEENQKKGTFDSTEMFFKKIGFKITLDLDNNDIFTANSCIYI